MMQESRPENVGISGYPKPYQLNFIAEYHDRLLCNLRQVPKDITSGIFVVEFEARTGEENRFVSGFLPQWECTRELLATYGLPAEAADSIIEQAKSQDLQTGVWTILSELSDEGRSYFFFLIKIKPNQPRKFDPYRYGRVLN